MKKIGSAVGIGVGLVFLVLGIIGTGFGQYSSFYGRANFAAFAVVAIGTWISANVRRRGGLDVHAEFLFSLVILIGWILIYSMSIPLGANSDPYFKLFISLAYVIGSPNSTIFIGLVYLVVGAIWQKQVRASTDEAIRP